MSENFELPLLNEQDSVGALIERMLVELRHPAQENFSDEYCRVRAILRRHPQLKHTLPDFLRECKTVAEFQAFMNQKFGQTFEWDAHVGNSLARLTDTLKATTSLEPYEIKQELGWGGFGRVYLAKHRMTERHVAIKFFQPAFHQGGGSLVTRFFQEATMLFQLCHPNIVSIRDIAMFQERPFIVMDYFDGVTLTDALRLHGQMPPEKSVAMIQAVAEAIHHAHERKIVHRDLKPSNIMLSPGECRVIDFGLGVFIENDLLSRLTNTGEAPAGGHFTAKELLSDPTNISPKCDVYSIGAIWYAALTNEVPAGSDLAKSLDLVDDLPQKHKAIVLKCLADAENRFADCSVLLSAIAEEATE